MSTEGLDCWDDYPMDHGCICGNDCAPPAEVRSTDTPDDIACGGVIEVPDEIRDALAARITPEMQAKQGAARERTRERNQRLGVRSTDTSEDAER